MAADSGAVYRCPPKRFEMMVYALLASGSVLRRKRATRRRLHSCATPAPAKLSVPSKFQAWSVLSPIPCFFVSESPRTWKVKRRKGKSCEAHDGNCWCFR